MAINVVQAKSTQKWYFLVSKPILKKKFPRLFLFPNPSYAKIVPLNFSELPVRSTFNNFHLQIIQLFLFVGNLVGQTVQLRLKSGHFLREGCKQKFRSEKQQNRNY